jgi:tRNA G18 (ribose-2'-O)-methylase SpoU
MFKLSHYQIIYTWNAKDGNYNRKKIFQETVLTLGSCGSGLLQTTLFIATAIKMQFLKIKR